VGKLTVANKTKTIYSNKIILIIKKRKGISLPLLFIYIRKYFTLSI